MKCIIYVSNCICISNFAYNCFMEFFMCIECLYNYLSNSIKFYCFMKLVKAMDRFIEKKIRDV